MKIYKLPIYYNSVNSKTMTKRNPKRNMFPIE